jgi:hypothetical protein
VTTTPAPSLGATLYQADGSAAARFGGTQACWLCGIHLPTTAMVPDGGSACADVYWYCADTKSCTQRWAKPQRRTATGGKRP